MSFLIVKRFKLSEVVYYVMTYINDFIQYFFYLHTLELKINYRIILNFNKSMLL